MTTTTTSSTLRRLDRVRPRDVADLTVTASYPCISVLMPTEPAPRMTAADVERLRGLAQEVDRQLRDHGVPAHTRLTRKLAARVEQVAESATDRSVVIYVSLAVDRTFWLSVPVTARAVVEPTFATRALVTALHRTPPHVLLLLHPTCAHVYRASGGAVRLVGSRDAFRGAGPADGFLSAVDQLLGSYRAEHPSPLVLGGSPQVVDRFCAVSRNLHRLAGRLPVTRGETADDLAQASFGVVEDYLRSRREEALTDLHHALASRPADVALGMAACWSAAHARIPGMLLVEHDFVCPGRPEDYGPPGAVPDPRPEDTAVHDLVDDLIEVVIARGGQLAVMDEGDLSDHGRVALLSRSPDRRR